MSPLPDTGRLAAARDRWVAAGTLVATGADLAEGLSILAESITAAVP